MKHKEDMIKKLKSYHKNKRRREQTRKHTSVQKGFGKLKKVKFEFANDAQMMKIFK